MWVCDAIGSREVVDVDGKGFLNMALWSFEEHSKKAYVVCLEGHIRTVSSEDDIWMIEDMKWRQISLSFLSR